MNILDIIFASKLGKKGYLKLNNNTDRLLARHLYNKSSGQVEIVTDTAPYVYRATPVQNAFKAKMHKIVGASVVWNQLVQNGNFASVDNWDKNGNLFEFAVSNNIGVMSNLVRYATVSQYFDVIQNHIYIIVSKVKTTSNGIPRLVLREYYEGTQYDTISSDALTSSFVTYKHIFKSNRLNSKTGIMFYEGGDATDGMIEFSNTYAVDLTAMFGTTIADYIYTLETQTAGSGIAWLQSYGFFTEDYYAYQTNTIESVNTSGRKVVGKNRLDLALAYLKEKNTSGTWVDNKYTLNNVTFTVNDDMTISTSGTANANTSFYLKNEGEDCPFTNYKLYGCASGGSNNTYYLRISDVTTSSNNDYGSGASITISQTGQWRLFIMILNNVNANGLTFKPMITFPNEDSIYEPYTTTTYPITPLTLRGIPYLDNGELKYNGDEYNADGTTTRKYGIVDLGSLDWTYYTSGTEPIFYTRQDEINLKIYSRGAIPQIMSNKYIVGYTVNSRSSLCTYLPDKTMSLIEEYPTIAIKDSSYTDAQTFKTAMSGVYLIYELATPTTEQTTPFTETEIVGSTEEFIDYEVAQSNRDVAIPVGTETDYSIRRN